MAGVDARAHPPGRYPVVVVGSGPGGLQTSYFLSRLGVEHAVISQDERPGGMFRRFPIFQRLLSWSKPDAPAVERTREYEWYDHNSLVADERALRATVPRFMDRSFFVPSRSEMEAGLEAFADEAAIRVRYGCRWESTRREDDGDLTLVTSDGEYRCRAAVFALGVTDPWKSDIPGVEHVPHYVETRAAHEYAGKRVVVIGKRNSGFEVADALLPWARQVVLVSPRPVQTSVIALSTVRVRYMQPLEDAQLGGGTLVLDAAIERIERTADGVRVQARGTTAEGELVLDADEAIAATGFRTPLADLPRLGVQTVAQGRIPALTPFWESATAPGIYFAGNATQGAAGLRKHGVGASSPAVYGFRYNARVLARRLAERVAGIERDTRPLGKDEAVPFLLAELAHAPELWAQKAYLARVVSFDGAPRDDGIEPLAHFVDAAGPDAVAATVELDGSGEIYPVLYVRRRGSIHERVLPPDPLNRFHEPGYRAEVEAAVREVE
ncbi:MAG: NAD(P)-binding domain-containing protein [Thermoleophilia bacterium]|nr:NAD(P)-binding domain-containing protein [Thermoleophilia bacterium]